MEQEHKVLDTIIAEGFKTNGELFADLKIYTTKKEMILYDAKKDSVYHRFEKPVGGKQDG